MLKWSLRILLALAAIALLSALAAWWLLRGSLPVLDGTIALPGLSTQVTVQRDALGVVTIDAANETDAARALGYVHAQERFFEMDLMRRTSAGELAELFGPIAVDVDRKHRVHRMRARVEAGLDVIAAGRRPELEAYAEGVNAGLAALRVRPWPYLLLRQQPRPWTVADSALTGYAMYFDLQDSTNAREMALTRLKLQLPAPLFRLIAHDGSSWDAPLLGEARGDATLPSADEVDLRQLPAPEPARQGVVSSQREPATTGVGKASRLTAAGSPESIGWPVSAAGYFPGSNNFAVSGTLTADGRAIVADDMHLGLRAPNIWFRARLRYPDAAAPNGRVDVQGFTLPGLPAVIVGSNGHVAWGFTNSYADTADWALLKLCVDGEAAEDCAATTTTHERIRVAGGDDVVFPVTETAWGPVLSRESDGRGYALRWIAHLPGSLNFALADLARSRSLETALAVSDRTAIPAQNLLIADHRGRVGWRLTGPLPDRGDRCPAHAGIALAIDRVPEQLPGPNATDAHCFSWQLATGIAPALASPTRQLLWTANSRTLDGAVLARVGDGGYALGARARQIRDGLFAKQRFDERDLLDIQLDDRALLMTRWWELLQALAQDGGDAPALRELVDASKTWQGRASTDSASYRIVRAWRLAVHARLIDGLVAPARAALGDDFVTPDLPQFEGVAWPLVSQRPAHLLPRRFDSWQALFEDAAEETRDELSAGGPLPERTWGEHNTAAICHPLAGALPEPARRRLCMPPDPLPGDAMMPRVQGPAFGASERMVVSPGHEADGIIHMPGGQSGHPLSPFWGAGHEDWVHGRPSPFLPGATAHTLALTPR